MIYILRDHKWISNATKNPWANCLEQNPEHEYHVIQTLEWSLQITKITLSFDVKSESIYYGKTRIKSDLEKCYCCPNHAIETIVIWELNYNCPIFVVGRSHSRMIPFQTRYFIETLADNKTITGHQQNAHI